MSSSDDTHTPIAVGKNCLELGIAYRDLNENRELIKV
jgi:hypothetical protein